MLKSMMARPTWQFDRQRLEKLFAGSGSAARRLGGEGGNPYQGIKEMQRKRLGGREMTNDSRRRGEAKSIIT